MVTEDSCRKLMTVFLSSMGDTEMQANLWWMGAREMHSTQMRKLRFPE